MSVFDYLPMKAKTGKLIKVSRPLIVLRVTSTSFGSQNNHVASKTIYFGRHSGDHGLHSTLLFLFILNSMYSEPCVFNAELILCVIYFK